MHNKQLSRIYLLPIFILIFLVTGKTWGKNAIVLSDQEDYQVINSDYIEIFEDISGNLTIDSIIGPTYSSNFSAVNRNYALNENIGSVYWARFEMQNLSTNYKKWLLEVLDSRQNEIQLFQLRENNTYQLTPAGIDGNFSNREYEHKNFIFEIYPNSTKQVYYLRIKSLARTSFLIKISTSKFLLEYGLNEYYYLGIYYGILLIMAIYSLFVFFMIRERVYFFYLLYIVSWVYNSMLADGTGYQYLWPSIPFLSQIGTYLSRPLILVMYVFYSLAFLKNTEKPTFDKKYLHYALLTYLIIYPIQFIYDWALVHNVLFIIPFIVIFYFSLVSYKNGYKPARYLLLGNFVLMFSVFITFLKYSGLIDFLSKYWTVEIIVVYSTNIAMVINILILSFSLADRLKYFKVKQEKTQELLINQYKENQQLADKVNRELEEKVVERTKEIEANRKEIEAANKKLQEQAVQINEMNAQLDLDNWKLKKRIIEEKESRIKFKGVNFEEFKQVYPNENICFQLLEDMKWEKGYSCKRCNNDKFGKGSNQFSRRCTKCRYDESVTTDTIFHKCKFEINKALYILVIINRNGEQQSISELANEVDLRLATCWNFAQKVLKLRNSKEFSKLDDENKFRYLIFKKSN